jgi:hypothetical protein
MSRETKHERLVRSMLSQVSEHLYELKNLAANQLTKELDVERWCQSILKNCLGFTASQGYSIGAQEVRGKMRPDLIVSREGKTCFVVEVKKLGFDLSKADFRSGKVQLSEYLKNCVDARWGILCNGYEWRLFDFTGENSAGVEILSLDLRGDNEELDTSKRGIEESAWNFIDLHESNFEADNWSTLSKEATAFSPDSLAKAILSFSVIKTIAKTIRGEHEYKANTEVLFDKVYDLLDKGLDDSVPGWNETKQAELTRYLRAQKREGQKRPKNTKADKVDLKAQQSSQGFVSTDEAPVHIDPSIDKKAA